MSNKISARSSIQMSTSTELMNMSNNRSATTISTITQPFRRIFKIKRGKGARGTNALYRAINAENWDLVRSICELKAYKAESWHNAPGFFDAHRSSKILPLHLACIFHPPADALEALVRAYPPALRSQESGYGRLPLHIACHSSAALQSIEVLIRNYPMSSVEKDIIGRVPLHYALSNGASPILVDLLLDAADKSCPGYNGARMIASSADYNGWLPLHVACHMGASREVINRLVNVYPDGSLQNTKKGSSPLSLLKSLSISEERRNELEHILLQRDRSVRGKLEAIGDDTVDGAGVSLNLEGETSSISSMEDTATVRTGTTNRTNKTNKKKSSSSLTESPHVSDREKLQQPEQTPNSHTPLRSRSSTSSAPGLLQRAQSDKNDSSPSHNNNLSIRHENVMSSPNITTSSGAPTPVTAGTTSTKSNSPTLQMQRQQLSQSLNYSKSISSDQGGVGVGGSSRIGSISSNGGNTASVSSANHNGTSSSSNGERPVILREISQNAVFC